MKDGRDDRAVPFAAGPLHFDMPVFASVDPWALLLSVASVVAVICYKAGMLTTLAASSGAGVLLYLLGAVT